MWIGLSLSGRFIQLEVHSRESSNVSIRASCKLLYVFMVVEGEKELRSTRRLLRALHA